MLPPILDLDLDISYLTVDRSRELDKDGAGSWSSVDRKQQGTTIGNSVDKDGAGSGNSVEQANKRADVGAASIGNSRERRDAADVVAASIGAASIVGSSSPQAVVSFGCKLNGIQKISCKGPLTGETYRCR